MTFSPIAIYLDNAVYEVPFDRWFRVESDSTMVMIVEPNEDNVVLGVQFLNMFYQVYDMERNQVALVHSAYNTNLESPSIAQRNPFGVIISCITALFISVLGFASLYGGINNENTEEEATATSAIIDA